MVNAISGEILRRRFRACRFFEVEVALLNRTQLERLLCGFKKECAYRVH